MNQRSPGPEALLREGVQRHQAGDLSGAAAIYRRVLRAFPREPDALHLLGLVTLQEGAPAQAEAMIRGAIAGRPDIALFHYNLGKCLRELGRAQDAVAAWRSAVALRPDYVEALENLGNALADLHQPEEAQAAYRRVIALQPRWAGGYKHLGSLLAMEGETGAAGECLAAGLRNTGAPGLAMRLATLLAPIPDSAEAIRASRERIAAELDVLAASGAALADPLAEVGGTPFFLAYHGENDRDLQERLARTYLKLSPELAFEAAHCRVGRTPGRRIKVGFVCAYFRYHTVGRYFSAILTGLDRERFDVRVFFVGAPRQDEISRAVLARAEASAVLGAALAPARRVIADAELDVLVYPEIGMDPLTYFLAYARLAPVQLALYGHPVTTGIPNVDWFLSHRDCETAEAAAHYSERLLQLPSGVTYACFAPPRGGVPARSRAELGLPAQGRLYLCPQALMKLHPAFDPMLAQILRRDPEGRVVLARSQQTHWNELVLARLRRMMPDVVDRVGFLPWLGQGDFLAALAAADVVLDTPHFSGGATTFDAFAAGAPVVTLPGRFLRGRQTFALYKRMDLMDGVANSEQDYVERAIALASDRERRAALCAGLAERGRRIFGDTGAVTETARLIEELARERRP